MNTELRPLLSKLCRMTAIDKIALGFAVAFLFMLAAAAALAFFAIGDAPQGRMWNILGEWAGIGFAVGIAAPWAVCRTLHAAGHTARFAYARRAAQPRAAQITPLYQGHVA